MSNPFGYDELGIPKRGRAITLAVTLALASVTSFVTLTKVELGSAGAEVTLILLGALSGLLALMSLNVIADHHSKTGALRNLKELLELRDNHPDFAMWWRPHMTLLNGWDLKLLPMLDLNKLQINRATLANSELSLEVHAILCVWRSEHDMLNRNAETPTTE